MNEKFDEFGEFDEGAHKYLMLKTLRFIVFFFFARQFII